VKKETLGKVEHPWQDTAYLLSLFCKTIESSPTVYPDVVLKGIVFGRWTELFGDGLIHSAGG
jgi:hypothetical protein